MKNNLCPLCSESMDCQEPELKTECKKFEPYDQDIEILTLFYGMSTTMQQSIIEIMKVTQLKK